MADSKKQRILALMQGWLPNGETIDDHALANVYARLSEFRASNDPGKSIQKEHERILGFKLNLKETEFLRLLYVVSDYKLCDYLRFVIPGYVADVDRTVFFLQEKYPRQHDQMYALISAKKCMEMPDYKHCPGKHELLDAIRFIPLKHENYKVLATTEVAVKKLMEHSTGLRPQQWLACEIYSAGSIKGVPKEQRSIYKKIQSVDAMDLLTRLHVNPAANDVSLELGLMFELVCKHIDPKGDNQLLALVNVSSLLVKRIIGLEILKAIPLLIVEPTSERRDLMSKSKRIIKRCETGASVTCASLSELVDTKHLPAITMMVCGTAGKLSGQNLPETLQHLQPNLAENCRIIILSSTAYAEKTPNEFITVDGNSCIKKEVHLLPQQIPRSKKPKRKSLTIYLYKTKLNKKPSSPCYSNHQLLQLEDRFVLDQVTAAELNLKRESHHLEPIDILDRQTFVDTEIALQKLEVEERRTPPVHYLAPELPIEYIIDGNYLTACFCYPKMNKGKEMPGTCGRRIQSTFRRIRDKKIISQGLHYIMHDYPYSIISKGLSNERHIRVTVAQERQKQLKGKPISLRALWYLYPSEELFVESDLNHIQPMLLSELGLIIPGETTSDEIIQRADVYSKKQQIGIQTVCRLLKLLIDRAVKEKHCSSNALKHAVIPVRRKKRNRKQEVERFRLVRSLPHHKMLELYKLLEPDIENDPYAFGAILRFFTGLPSNILCALQQNSIQLITGYKGYYMNILRQVTNDGKVIKNFENARSKLRFPFPALLEDPLLKLRKRIEASGTLTNNEICQLPLLLASTADFSEDAVRKSITPKQLEKYCREVLKTIGMNFKIIEYYLPDKGAIELNKARQVPNFPRSNFEYHLIETGQIEEADLMYLTSRKGPDILSIHYVGFSSMGMLYNMRAVLERWYATFTMQDQVDVTERKVEKLVHSTSIRRKHDGKRLGKAILEMYVPKGQTVSIRINCEHGARITSI